VQLQPGAQGLAVLQTFGEFSEEAEFDGTKQVFELQKPMPNCKIVSGHISWRKNFK
jgi:hypothetical protein